MAKRLNKQSVHLIFGERLQRTRGAKPRFCKNTAPEFYTGGQLPFRRANQCC